MNFLVARENHSAAVLNNNYIVVHNARAATPFRWDSYKYVFFSFFYFAKYYYFRFFFPIFFSLLIHVLLYRHIALASTCCHLNRFSPHVRSYIIYWIGVYSILFRSCAPATTTNFKHFVQHNRGPRLRIDTQRTCYCFFFVIPQSSYIIRYNRDGFGDDYIYAHNDGFLIWIQS